MVFPIMAGELEKSSALCRAYFTVSSAFVGSRVIFAVPVAEELLPVRFPRQPMRHLFNHARKPRTGKSACATELLYNLATKGLLGHPIRLFWCRAILILIPS